MAFLSCAGMAKGETAQEILDATGVKGGLVVCIGCDDPGLLIGLRANDSYVVQGLDTDSKLIVVGCFGNREIT